MIVGFFNSSDRPIVRSRLYFPRFRRWVEVAFLLDTGAVSTCLNFRDSLNMRVSPEDMAGNAPVTLHGLGGSVEYYVENAYLFFRNGDGPKDVVGYTLDLPFTHDRRTSSLPSLLGQDIWSRWNIECDYLAGRLHCSPRTYDWSP